jgi:outer membrane beta-barrel protein
MMLLSIILWFAVSSSVQAAPSTTTETNVSKDVYDLPPQEVIMNQKYKAKDELSLKFGYLPIGAFNKFAGGGLSYTHMFNQNHGWEIVNGIYVVELEQNLKKLLVAEYGATKQDFNVLRGLVTSNYQFAPFYSKSLVFNRYITHSQLSILIGGGMALFEPKKIPTADIGLVQKFHLNQRFGLNFDFRYYYFFSNERVRINQISMLVGLTLNF